MGTGTLRSTDDRAKVMRIFKLVADNDKRILAALLCKFKNIVNRRIFMRGNVGGNTLVVSFGAKIIKLALVNLFNYNALFFAFGDYSSDRTAALSLCNKKGIKYSSGAKSFGNSVAADNKLRFAVFLYIFVFVIILILLYLCAAAHTTKAP